jgi:ATPase subunit of ABC transporter with duplicated ATPase domains
MHRSAKGIGLAAAVLASGFTLSLTTTPASATTGGLTFPERDDVLIEEVGYFVGGDGFTDGAPDNPATLTWVHSSTYGTAPELDGKVHFDGVENCARVVLVGRNGLGKTTLLKALLAEADGADVSVTEIDGGKVRWGHETSIGYFPQDHTGTIQKGMTAVEWLHQFDPSASRQEIHGLLGQMLFSGEEGLKPTEALSGGETARMLFCRIMLQKPNVLVLDEPTNHLDLESINALNVALQRFEGTVLLATHDQDVMEEVGTRVWHFAGGAIHDFQGTYEEYTASVA